ncbi:EF-hand domain-containing protein [Planctomicrobium piriforme]|uniref:EF hand n=1 Tax=Planctomicrobium piriforme TaxID=1576369 RepID=A0A1I3CIJ4_9PLAN|nr:EF-hand domain-containing protein [Planctomicrobium piriforme]SFH74248.1 EF hand [Planctomicrobium piriforme]
MNWLFQISFSCCVLLLSVSAFCAEVPQEQGEDALLLLSDGPVHVRFHLLIDEQQLAVRRQEFISNLIQRLDADSDGQLSQTEWQQSPLHQFGKKEVGNEFLKTLGTSRPVPRKNVEQDLARFGELISYRQDDTAAGNDLKVFELLDADKSGHIDAAEIQSAEGRIALLDGDRDECVSFEEFSPPPQPDPDSAEVVRTGMLSDELPKAFLANLIRDISDIRLPADLLRLYDRDKDRLLSATELGGDERRITPLDVNQDGKLSVAELRGLRRLPVDLELRIELSGAKSGQSSLQVLSSAAHQVVPAHRSDLVKLAFGKTGVTFAFRNLDPIQSALTNARQRFNTLDIDANGYLDRKEISGNPTFERIWFHAMDRNRDGMLYDAEMQDYVRAICEPAATTCHINVYDTGPGYFQLLDHSGDGRISVREMRNLQPALAAHQKNDGAGISPDDMGQNYFIEFVRGSYQVFGASRRLVAQGPTFIERDPIGPNWFQAIDRNRDGDLTYLVVNPLHPPEFLYTLNLAHEMDADRDGLISWNEAERFEQQFAIRQSRAAEPQLPATP